MALLLPKLLELIVDPWLGWRSDRLTTRWGRRRPLLLAGALAFPPAFALLFATPDLAGWPARLAFVTAAYALSTTAYSLFAVPFVALPGDLSDETRERTRLVAFRMAFVALGILLAGAGGPALIQALGGGRDAYAAAGLAMAGLSGCAMLAAVIGARTARVEAGVRGESFSRALLAVARAGAFRRLGFAYFLQMASNGANAAMLAYAAKYLLGAGETLVGLFFGVFTIASLAGTPAFAFAGRRWTKRAGLVRSTWIYAASMVLLLAAVRGGEPALLAAAVVAGLGNAGTQLFAFALLPDVLDAERARTGVAREGVFTGVWIAGEKLGLAAGAALVGLLLDASGFVEGRGASQPAAALTMIALLLSVVPALLMAASALLFTRGEPTENSDER